LESIVPYEHADQLLSIAPSERQLARFFARRLSFTCKDVMTRWWFDHTKVAPLAVNTVALPFRPSGRPVPLSVVVKNSLTAIGDTTQLYIFAGGRRDEENWDRAALCFKRDGRRMVFDKPMFAKCSEPAYMEEIPYYTCDSYRKTVTAPLVKLSSETVSAFECPAAALMTKTLGYVRLKIPGRGDALPSVVNAYQGPKEVEPFDLCMTDIDERELLDRAHRVTGDVPCYRTVDGRDPDSFQYYTDPETVLGRVWEAVQDMMSGVGARVVDGRFEERRLMMYMMLNAIHGGGKSVLIRGMMQHWVEENPAARIIYIVPRVSLVQLVVTALEQCEGLNVVSYAVPSNEVLMGAHVIVTTVNSVARIMDRLSKQYARTEEPECDCRMDRRGLGEMADEQHQLGHMHVVPVTALVIDELNCVLDTLFGGLVDKDRVRILATMQAWIALARWLVCADADFNAINFLFVMPRWVLTAAPTRRLGIVKVIHEGIPPAATQERKAYVGTTQQAVAVLKTKIKEDVRCAAFFSSLKQMKYVVHELKSDESLASRMRAKGAIVQVSGSDRGRVFLMERILRSRLLIYTSAFSVGCSIDQPEFDSVFAFIGQNIGTYETRQAMERVRNFKNLYVAGYGRPWPRLSNLVRMGPRPMELASFASIMQRLRSVGQMTSTVIMRPAMNGTMRYDDERSQIVWATETWAHYASGMAYVLDHLSKCNARGLIIGLLAKAGYRSIIYDKQLGAVVDEPDPIVPPPEPFASDSEESEFGQLEFDEREVVVAPEFADFVEQVSVADLPTLPGLATSWLESLRKKHDVVYLSQVCGGISFTRDDLDFSTNTMMMEQAPRSTALASLVDGYDLISIFIVIHGVHCAINEGMLRSRVLWKEEYVETMRRVFYDVQRYRSASPVPTLVKERAMHLAERVWFIVVVLAATKLGSHVFNVMGQEREMSMEFAATGTGKKTVVKTPSCKKRAWHPHRNSAQPANFGLFMRITEKRFATWPVPFDGVKNRAAQRALVRRIQRAGVDDNHEERMRAYVCAAFGVECITDEGRVAGNESDWRKILGLYSHWVRHTHGIGRLAKPTSSYVDLVQKRVKFQDYTEGVCYHPRPELALMLKRCDNWPCIFRAEKEIFDEADGDHDRAIALWVDAKAMPGDCESVRALREKKNTEASIMTFIDGDDPPPLPPTPEPEDDSGDDSDHGPEVEAARARKRMRMTV